ncbi:PD-(D/E)XK motif protein [Nakamurella lactea]|uniref:PD-(D/E)XK motif protein n=1 Tax=Nakamurella lactea TaxID=459515 RepID=UPI000A065AB7|nr:PD-(D/E)XK motif protein [Nakamurella lactea]
MTSDSAGAFVLLGGSTARRDNLRIRDSGLVLAGGPVAHAIDFDGRQLLLIPLTDEQPGVDDELSRGVSLHTRQLIDAGQRRRYLSVRCEIPALAGTFASLCDDLLAALATDSDDPAGASLGIIGKWRDLLGQSRTQLLSEGQLLGILCELQFLEQLVQLAAPEAALAVWTGPGSERQDFMSSSVSVEIKGCGLRDRIAVEIHGLRQLEEPTDGRLFLWVQHVERVNDDGDSVPDVIGRLDSAGVSRHAVLSLLAGVGYESADEDAYRSVRFELLDRRAYEITPSFPRLVPANLTNPGNADRLLSVRYTLDLTDRNAEPRPMEYPIDVVNTLAEAIR